MCIMYIIGFEKTFDAISCSFYAAYVQPALTS